LLRSLAAQLALQGQLRSQRNRSWMRARSYKAPFVCSFIEIASSPDISGAGLAQQKK
jgi:hypothetical protein